jgi:hypothetical protein
VFVCLSAAVAKSLFAFFELPLLKYPGLFNSLRPCSFLRPLRARTLLPTQKRRRRDVDTQAVCPNSPEFEAHTETHRRAYRAAYSMLHQSRRRAFARRAEPINPNPGAPVAVADSLATTAVFCLGCRFAWPRRGPQTRRRVRSSN